MTEVIQIQFFSGATAETACNDFLDTKISEEIVSVTAVYDVGASEINFLVTYRAEN
jgi:hypothetical protein